MYLKSLCAITLLFCSLQTVHATEKTYQVVPNADSSPGASFFIGYTLGTHNGVANTLTGLVQLDTSPLLISNAEVIVPIANINSFNEKRNCHLREALGLNYALSVYPESQVCSGDNTLPLSGPDSITYSEIKFNLSSLMNSSPNDSLKPGIAKSVVATGTLNLHGVRREIQVPLTLTLNANSSNTINVKGDFDLNISDYGIIVRKVLFVTVKDVASVSINLTLKEI